jgi:predicted RNase H-like HicB family nuclease
VNTEVSNHAKAIADLNYSLTIFKDVLTDGTEIFLAKNPELLGCMAQGQTQEEAINNLREARIDYISSLLEDGMNVPSPKLELESAPTLYITPTIYSIYPTESTIVINYSFNQDKTPVTKSNPIYEVLTS